jgi:aminoglycoside phosphotransferase (APT) family kinase protein
MTGGRGELQLSALAEVGTLLDRSGFEYWLFGGWAVDFHVGAVTREHDDVDLAVWLDDAEAIGSLLEAESWRHAPTGDEDGGIGYERGGVRLELTFLTSDDAGRVFVPLRHGSVLWAEEPLGNEMHDLLGVRSRVLGLALLKHGKSSARDDPGEAAKDRTDFKALSMRTGRMHAEELDTDVSLVRRLLTKQFPQWADLPIEPVDHAGTDNAIYRLGDHMAVRLPRIHWATGQPDREQEWLPRLAPHLPLAVPVPLATGEPAEGYPWRWSVVPWLEGETTTVERIADPSQAAADLARFVAALQRIDATGAPAAGRGVPLVQRDAETRTAIEALHGIVDVDAVAAVWEAALRLPASPGPPVWIHGDLISGNLLFDNGRLIGVIDFGGVGVGDPAGDTMAAWTFLSAETREVFRAALSIDDATWARGRGLALSWALIALPYYMDTFPRIVRDARRTIAEVLADTPR